MNSDGLLNSSLFLKEFLAKPSVTGAIAPSSAFLAGTMVENLDLPNAKAVLEYGPGTGSFTEYVVQRLPPASKFVAIELNPKPGGRVQSKVSQN